MQVFGLGAEGNIIGNFAINDGATTTGPKVAEVLFSHIVSIQVISKTIGGAFAGTILIEGSNNFCPPAGGLNYGQRQNAGDWTDITTQFTPAPAAINANGTQMFQSPANGAGWRHIRMTISRTSGAGTSIVVDVWVCGKGA